MKPGQWPGFFMDLSVLLKLLFIIFSCFIAVFDIKTGGVPRIYFIIAFPVFFILMVFSNLPLVEAVVGLFAGLFAYLLAYFISGKKLGLADVWYSALSGLVLGSPRWGMAIIIGCAAGIIFILVFKQRKIPFIPCMALGAIIMCFF